MGNSRQRETEPGYHKKRKSAIAVTLGDREILFPRYIILVLDSDLFNESRTRQIFYRIYRGFLEILEWKDKKLKSCIFITPPTLPRRAGGGEFRIPNEHNHKTIFGSGAKNLTIKSLSRTHLNDTQGQFRAGFGAIAAKDAEVIVHDGHPLFPFGGICLGEVQGKRPLGAFFHARAAALAAVINF